MEKESKQKKCPNGTRRNKKTGECEKKKSRSPKSSKSPKSPKSSKSPESSKSKVMKPDWDKNTKRIAIKHKGRIFTFMVIPQGNYIYRGLQYGQQAVSERGVAFKPTQEEIERNDKYNLEHAKRAKNGGLYYGTLAVACYYALNLDNGPRITHEVMEFKPKHNLMILDMSVWQNLKNIADDCGPGTEFEDKDSILEYSHGFYKNDPQKKLVRDSGGIDTEMTKFMLDWMKLDSSPKMDGFGHSMMPGFHSELTCVSREKSLELVNVFSTDDRFSHDLFSKTDVIHMDRLEYMTDGNTKPFKIQTLLQREQWVRS